MKYTPYLYSIIKTDRKMKRKTLVIAGQQIEAMKFSTRQAAERFIAKSDNRKLVYFRAHEYYVSY